MGTMKMEVMDAAEENMDDSFLVLCKFCKAEFSSLAAFTQHKLEKHKPIAGQPPRNLPVTTQTVKISMPVAKQQLEVITPDSVEAIEAEIRKQSATRSRSFPSPASNIKIKFPFNKHLTTKPSQQIYKTRDICSEQEPRICLTRLEDIPKVTPDPSDQSNSPALIRHPIRKRMRITLDQSDSSTPMPALSAAPPFKTPPTSSVNLALKQEPYPESVTGNQPNPQFRTPTKVTKKSSIETVEVATPPAQNAAKPFGIKVPLRSNQGKIAVNSGAKASPNTTPSQNSAKQSLKVRTVTTSTPASADLPSIKQSPTATTKSVKTKKPRKRWSLNGHRCSYCGKIFNSDTAKRQHVFNHTRPFTCPQCHKGWPSESALQAHISKVHNSKKSLAAQLPREVRTYTCDECPFTTMDKYNLGAHRNHHGTAHANKCTECSCTFVAIGALTRHITRCHPSLVKPPKEKVSKVKVGLLKVEHFISCVVCFKSIYFRHMLTHRKLAHPEVKPYYCTECPLTARNHRVMWEHKKAHTVRSAVACPYCSASFTTVLRANFHIRKVHPESPPLPGAGEKVLKEKSLKIRVLKEKVIKEKLLKEFREYPCSLCPKKFPTASYLERHVGTHTKPHHCPECPRRFPTKYALKSHLKRGHKKSRRLLRQLQRARGNQSVGVKAPPEPCPVCGVMIAGKEKLGQHFKIYHPKYEAYRCDHCPFKTANRYKFHGHSVLHRASNIFNCPSCSASFFTMVQREKHITSVHGGVGLDLESKPLTPRKATEHPAGYYKVIEGPDLDTVREKGVAQTCRICGTETTSRIALEHHFTQKHPNTKAYKCDDCPFECISYSTLSGHSKIHTEENEFQCDYCSGSFPDTVRRSMHMKKVHKAELALEATLAAVPQKDATNRDHANAGFPEAIIKTEEKSGGYMCSHCCKTFPISIALKVHQRRFHNLEQDCSSKYFDNVERHV